MIQIHFQEKDKDAVMEIMHDALAGWKAYVDSEVVLSDDFSGVDLLIGPNNGHDIHLDIFECVGIPMNIQKS